MKIILMRHGKPHLADWPRIDAAGMGRWLDAYLRSDVAGSEPTAEARDAARECNAIVTSDLARSQASAASLDTGDRRVTADALFREASWPYTAVPLVKLQPYSWAAVFRILWFLGYRKNCREPVAALKQRAALAAERLISLAQAHGCVLLVGHGILNTFIARALRQKGWKGPLLPGYGYWQVARYTR